MPGSTQPLKPINVKIDNDEIIFRRELLREVDNSMKVLDLRIQGLRDMMEQHDKLIKIADDKAQETLNERLSKMNEFREQQKDIISNFATVISLDALANRMDINVHTATERFDRNTTVLNEKIAALKASFDEKIAEVVKHSDEKVDTAKKNLDDRRELLYGLVQETLKGIQEKHDVNIKSVQEKIDANIKSELTRFESTDKQMLVLINANAEVSNAGIKSLNSSRDRQTGSLTVITWVLGVVATIVVSLVVGFLSKYF